VVSNAAGNVASEKWSSVKATASSDELDRTVFDQCVVTDSSEDATSIPVAPTEVVMIDRAAGGGRCVATNNNAKLHLTTGVNVFANQSGWPVGTDTVQSGWPGNTKLSEQSRPLTVSSCATVNVLVESAEANMLSREREQTVHDQSVVTNREGDGASTARSTIKAEKLFGNSNWTDFDQSVQSSSEAEDEASKKLESLEAETSSGEQERMVLDQCVVTKCIVSGASSLVAPMETGKMAVTTPRASTLSVSESVWTDTLSGELERTRSDQCVVSNGTSRMLALVETGLLTEATNERLLKRNAFPPVLANLAEAWSSVIGTVKRALQAITGQCRVNEDWIGGWVDDEYGQLFASHTLPTTVLANRNPMARRNCQLAD
jgi:hypothetical protein